MQAAEFLQQCPEAVYSGPAFRAIFTSFPTRNLHADLGFREGDPDYDILLDLANTDPSIDFARPQQYRPFQYSDMDVFLRNFISELIPRNELIYPLQNALKGRFSDGSRGVFYAAAEEDTALAEVAHHFVRDCLYDLEKSSDLFLDRVVDKRVVRLELDVKNIRDFRPYRTERPELIADSLDYCQQLGRLCRQGGISLVLTPSARTERGTCMPIFSESALPYDQVRTLRYYHFKYDRVHGLQIKKSDLHQTDMPIPSDWIR